VGKGFRVVDLDRVAAENALEAVERDAIGYRFDVYGKQQAGFELVCESDQ
jgi:hypothetical protein